MYANDVKTNGKLPVWNKKVKSSLDFLCYLIVKEHNEFGGAFQALFSPLVNNIWQYKCKCLDPGGVDWVASHPSCEQPRHIIIFGETNENRGTQFQPFEANQNNKTV